MVEVVQSKVCMYVCVFIPFSTSLFVYSLIYKGYWVYSWERAVNVISFQQLLSFTCWEAGGCYSHRAGLCVPRVELPKENSNHFREECGPSSFFSLSSFLSPNPSKAMRLGMQPSQEIEEPGCRMLSGPWLFEPHLPSNLYASDRSCLQSRVGGRCEGASPIQLGCFTLILSCSTLFWSLVADWASCRCLGV